FSFVICFFACFFFLCCTLHVSFFLPLHLIYISSNHAESKSCLFFLTFSVFFSFFLRFPW
ncbi:hypothetical protein BC940DRAFT_252030, partial [Gongronella butleri]